MTDTLNYEASFNRNTENENTDNTSQRLLDDSFFQKSDAETSRSTEDTNLPQLCFFGDEPADKQVSDETVKGYVKSFQNLKDNGGANQETLDAFKNSVKNLQDLDAKSLEKELTKASKNPKVEMMLVAMHLKEVLESSGFKNISSDLQRKEGSMVLKHDASETYISLQFNSNKGKEGASVSIERKR